MLSILYYASCSSRDIISGEASWNARRSAKAIGLQDITTRLEFGVLLQISGQPTGGLITGKVCESELCACTDCLRRRLPAVNM